MEKSKKSLMPVLITAAVLAAIFWASSKFRAAENLSYKLSRLYVKKLPFYKYLTGIPIVMEFFVKNDTAVQLPFTGFFGTAAIKGVPPVPIKVLGDQSQKIKPHESTKLIAETMISTGAISAIIIDIIKSGVPRQAEIKGTLQLGTLNVPISTTVNFLVSDIV